MLDLVWEQTQLRNVQINVNAQSHEIVKKFCFVGDAGMDGANIRICYFY